MAFGINDPLNFCIMTSANYITKALVMYDSLIKECNNEFNLFYYTFDELTYDYLTKLNYKNIIIIPLHDLEKFYPELNKIKSTRSSAEYFFTCTPLTIDYILKKYAVKHVIYLDADLYFYQDPMIILNELKNNSVLITEHRYFPPKDNHPSGKYCVQFMPFFNDDVGNEVVSWWKQKCMEWCYMRIEDGKWADQGYLNNWPEIFRNIVVMKNRGAGIASWNIDAYIFRIEENKLKAFNKEIDNDVDVIFYHFQGVKIYANKLMTLGISKRKKNAYEFIYKDYINKLSEKENELEQKLDISRKEFNYQLYSHTNYRLFLSEIKRCILPKKEELIFFYKYLKRYKWLP